MPQNKSTNTEKDYRGLEHGSVFTSPIQKLNFKISNTYSISTILNIHQETRLNQTKPTKKHTNVRIIDNSLC